MSVGQFYTTVGVCSGYFVCYGSVKLTSSLSWRIPFILQAILAFILAIGCAVLPSSPRWLVLHGRRDEAIKAVEQLGIEREEAEKDILAVTGVDHEQLDKGYWQGITAIFRQQYRKRTSLALLVLGAAQLSGIDGVLYVRIYSLYGDEAEHRVIYNQSHSTHQPSSPKPASPPKPPASSLQASPQS